MGYLDFANQLRNLATTIDATREADSIRIASELSALVRNRVQNDRTDANGSSFGGYSQAVVPQYYFYGRSLSEGAEDKVKDGDWFLSYEDFREDNNLQTEAKDFTFSGDMWRNTGVVDVRNTNSTTSVYYGGQTTRAAELISYHSEREGLSIIAASEQETQFATEAHEERIANAIKDIFN